jgi:hypothetical protein
MSMSVLVLIAFQANTQGLATGVYSEKHRRF